VHSRMCRLAALVGTVGATWLAAALGLGGPITSANDVSSGVLADPDIDVLSFHEASSVANVDATFDTYGPRGKPIVISDDGDAWSQYTPANMHAAMERTLVRGGHFEHLDPDVTDRGEQGLPISGIGDFTSRSIEHLQHLRDHSQPLPQPGILTRSGNKLCWNGQEIHLAGFSYYGAVCGDNCNIQGYLDALASHNVNFTRVFALDRWSNNGCSLTPFRLVSGNRCPGSKFDISQPDPAYFTRLRQFVTCAAQKGIVVQYCIFDRCGLEYSPSKPERWGRNPYNVENNINMRFALDGSNYPPAFTQTTGDVAILHSAFLNMVVETIGDCGNVIYEIMNEPLDAFPNNAGFHSWVADSLRTAFAPGATQVSIDLGVTDAEQGLARVAVSDGDTAPVAIGGRDARQNQVPNQDYYVYFNAADFFAYQGSKPNLYVTIHYYDTGSGSLDLQYDAAGSGNMYKNGGSVALTGTNTWKVHTYHVSDAYCGNRQNNGADFRIARSGGDFFYLDLIQVSLQPARIELAPSSIVRSVRRGTNLPSDTFTVRNSGGGTLAYTVSVSDNPIWLHVSSPGGTSVGESASFDITYSTAGLPSADQSSTILVQDADAVNSPQAIAVDLHVWQPADFDGDGDVDQEDFGAFQRCLSGSGVGVTADCAAADLDTSGAVDQADFSLFWACMAGAGQSPGC
jgi:hypothetical protein